MVTVVKIGKLALHYGILIIVLILMVGPLLWMFRVSLLKVGESIAFNRLFNSSFTLSNFVDLFRNINMGRPLFNSLLVGGIVTAGNILFCFMTAYALARYKYIVNRFLFVSVILILMIPAHITIIPLYLLCLKTGIYNTYWALILPWLVNPIGIFLVKQYLETLPPSMEEAARVDGAGEFKILFKIVMPLCKPALAVLAIQVFFTNWNSFLFPYILVTNDTLYTLPVALAIFQGYQAIDWQHLMAGSVIAVIPVLVVFIFMQRHIISGITAGSVKQ
ncbi:MAG: carbohydrate ABC transporter permease [candidate division Zixibacteria bacterium]|nr:carbohydrate ABC transporter permease [candidate division Zixibacteria bacterium]MDD5426007.1 carbohydrate ABC transporter permease [candidate division Zixibacteria bacterium]